MPCPGRGRSPPPRIPCPSPPGPRCARRGRTSAHCTSTRANITLPTPLPDQRKHHQRDEDSREAEHQVDEPHDQRIDAAAEIGGDQAERRPDPEGHDAADDTDREARAQAVDHGRQHVAALPVRAEPVDAARHALRAGAELGIHDADLHQVVGVLRRKPRPDNGVARSSSRQTLRRIVAFGLLQQAVEGTAEERVRLGFAEEKSRS